MIGYGEYQRLIRAGLSLQCFPDHAICVIDCSKTFMKQVERLLNDTKFACLDLGLPEMRELCLVKKVCRFTQRKHVAPTRSSVNECKNLNRSDVKTILEFTQRLIKHYRSPVVYQLWGGTTCFL